MPSDESMNTRSPPGLDEDNADTAVLPVVYDVPFVIAHRIEVFPEELLLFRCEFIPKGIGAFCEFHILF